MWSPVHLNENNDYLLFAHSGPRDYVYRDISEICPASIRLAYERIRKNIYKTPTLLSDEYSRLCGCQVYLKLENVQKTGSFKIRGSSNAVMRRMEVGD